MESGHALVVEWDFATDKDIKNDAETPNVNFGTGVDLGVKQFGCRKVQAATECAEVVLGIK